MGLFGAFLTAIAIAFTSLSYSSEEPPTKVNHLLYLVRSNKIAAALDLYKEYKETKGKHDGELLEQIALIILDQGMASHDEEKELISLYGASLAGVNSLLDLCEFGVKSKHPTTQLVSIQMAGQIQDDRASSLLCSAFSSDYLGIRMEAASYLALRKHSHAVGYIESLMHKLPPFFHAYFPSMYAQIGTTEAITILKKMIHSTELYTRIAATLSAGFYGRDDLIKDIRTLATHLNPAEQEAAVTAIGILKDSHSIELLEKIASTTGDVQVKLASYQALIHLGKKEYIEQVKTLAKNKDLFAITVLGRIEGSEDILFALSQDADRTVRFNAALSLLERKDSRAAFTALEILLSQKRDLGFIPHYSSGRALMHWKLVQSASAYSKDDKDQGILAISLGLREHTLANCLELDEVSFIRIAKELIRLQQKDLIPLLMHLLVSLKSEEAIAMLKSTAEELGAPFMRNYASLALSNMKIEGPYTKRIETWISTQKDTEMIRFRPMAAKTASETTFNYQLTPQENSALLVEALMLIVEQHEEKSLDILLEVLRNGHPKNHPVIAGLLIKALE